MNKFVQFRKFEKRTDNYKNIEKYKKIQINFDQIFFYQSE